jgi:hypothetical protein
VRVCHFHDDRPGIGICMRCRVVICAACCTRLDGVNHCHACLKALGTRREEPQARAGLWTLGATLLLGAGSLLLYGLCWLVSGSLAP